MKYYFIRIFNFVQCLFVNPLFFLLFCTFFFPAPIGSTFGKQKFIIHTLHSISEQNLLKFITFISLSITRQYSLFFFILQPGFHGDFSFLFFSYLGIDTIWRDTMGRDQDYTGSISSIPWPCLLLLYYTLGLRFWVLINALLDKVTFCLVLFIVDWCHIHRTLWTTLDSINGYLVHCKTLLGLIAPRDMTDRKRAPLHPPHSTQHVASHDRLLHSPNSKLHYGIMWLKQVFSTRLFFYSSCFMWRSLPCA